MSEFEGDIGILQGIAGQVYLLPLLNRWTYLEVSQPESENEVSKAFYSLVENLKEILDLASMPFELVRRSELDLLFQRILSVERIKRIPAYGQISEDTEEKRDEAALRAAESHLLEIVSNANAFEGETGAFHKRYMSKLAVLSRDMSQREKALNLLRMSLVGVWNSFEIFCKDSLIAYLNSNPQEFLKLVSNSDASKRFETKRFTIESLATHSFNLSQSMGSMLLDGRDLSDVGSIRAIFEALFPDDGQLSKLLSGRSVYLLCMKRHLIVHRRGVVDRQFLHQTEVKQPVGSKIMISPSDVEQHLREIFQLAKHILSLMQQKA